MEVLYPRCVGLDVHQASVVACVRIAEGARASHEVGTFETTTTGLLALADWLREAGCTHVAMEATGVYWKPVWHVLEGEFELVLANASHIRNVPGRKTDVNDAMWIADLLAHGLIRRQLRSAGCHSRAARSHAHAKAAGARSGTSRAAHPKDTGGCEHQDCWGDQPHHGRERSRLSRRAHRW
jgi:transposase